MIKRVEVRYRFYEEEYPHGKTCNKCKKKLPVRDYHLNSRQYLASRCKVCHAEDSMRSVLINKAEYSGNPVEYFTRRIKEAERKIEIYRSMRTEFRRKQNG